MTRMKTNSIVLLLLCTVAALEFISAIHAKPHYEVTLCIHDTWACDSPSLCETRPGDSCFIGPQGPMYYIPTVDADTEVENMIKSIEVRCLAEGHVAELEVYGNTNCSGNGVYTYMSTTGVCTANDDFYYKVTCDWVDDGQQEETEVPSPTSDVHEDMKIRACFYGPFGCNNTTPTCEEMPDHSCFKGPLNVFAVESVRIHCMEEGDSFLMELHNDPQCVDEPYHPIVGETSNCHENDVFSYAVECLKTDDRDPASSPSADPSEIPTQTNLPEATETPLVSPSMSPFVPSPTPTLAPLPSDDTEVSPVSTSSPLRSCFPADATVRLENGNIKRMDELAIDDRVMARTQEYSSIYFFGHRLVSGMFDFVQISIANGKKIELSKGHLLLANKHLIRAENVKVGDMLLDVLEGLMHPVTHVQAVRKQGLYNPHTMQGDIVVNDIQASSYTNAVHPSLAHMLLFPERLVYILRHGSSMTGTLFESSTPRYVSMVLDTSNIIQSLVGFT